uniref:Uncharacterized protein n=1 Tax=Arundo donax TaxID=35708 RepID=A0A0A9H0A4_ARUDO
MKNSTVLKPSMPHIWMLKKGDKSKHGAQLRIGVLCGVLVNSNLSCTVAVDLDVDFQLDGGK